MLSPSLAALASQEDTIIRAILNVLKLPSPAGKHFPITYTMFAALDVPLTLLKLLGWLCPCSQVLSPQDLCNESITPLSHLGPAFISLIQELTGQVLPWLNRL